VAGLPHLPERVSEREREREREREKGRTSYTYTHMRALAYPGDGLLHKLVAFGKVDGAQRVLELLVAHVRDGEAGKGSELIRTHTRWRERERARERESERERERERERDYKREREKEGGPVVHSAAASERKLVVQPALGRRREERIVA
jgi:zinc finger CCCH domain-containing protein 13